MLDGVGGSRRAGWEVWRADGGGLVWDGGAGFKLLTHDLFSPLRGDSGEC